MAHRAAGEGSFLRLADGHRRSAGGCTELYGYGRTKPHALEDLRDKQREVVTQLAERLA